MISLAVSTREASSAATTLTWPTPNLFRVGGSSFVDGGCSAESCNLNSFLYLTSSEEWSSALHLLSSYGRKYADESRRTVSGLEPSTAIAHDRHPAAQRAVKYAGLAYRLRAPPDTGRSQSYHSQNQPSRPSAVPGQPGSEPSLRSRSPG